MSKEKLDPSSLSGNKRDREENLARLLQERRALQRHKEGRGALRKKAEEFVSAINELREKFGSAAGVEKELGEEKRLREELPRLIESLEKEINKTASPEEIKRLENLSWKRLVGFLRERKRQVEILDKAQGALDNFRKMVFAKPVSEISSDFYQKIKEAESFVEEVKKSLEEKLPQNNFESFCAHYLLKLREYGRQLPSGIVETAYVKEQKERAKDILLKNRLIALVGETGTGKTRIAKKLAEELTGSYEFVPGHRFITKEDLFSYLGIGVKKTDPEEVPRLIEEAKKRYEEMYPEASEEEKREAEKWIESTVQGQAAAPRLATEIYAGGVLKAAQEGKIVIIDEFNYIPSNLLAGCNALVEAKPGEKVAVFGTAVEVKEGFGVILTGNITKSVFQNRYLQREKIDPALVNRLNSGLIEYSSLPQETNLSFQEAQERGEGVSRELFEVGLTLLSDKKGNVAGPQNLLEDLWKLSREFSLLQKIYAGGPISREIRLPNEQAYILEKYHASNRTFRSIVEQWKKDGYHYSLDWYIYENLIRPASIIAPAEAGQIFVLLKERGEFFGDESWEVINVDPSVQYRIYGIEAIEEDREGFRKKQRRTEKVRYFQPVEIAEAMSGKKAPPLTREEEEIKEAAIGRGVIEKYRELTEGYEELARLLEELENSVEAYCEDLKNIFGKN